MGPGAKQRDSPMGPGIPLHRGQQLPGSVTWSGQDRGGHGSRAQLTWPACRRRPLGQVPQRHCGPVPALPHSAPSLPYLTPTPLTAAWGPPELFPVLVLLALGEAACGKHISWVRGCASSPCPTTGLADRGRGEGRGMSREQGMWKAAHCGKQGRSRVLERDGGRELEDRASSGTARNLPEGERSHCCFLTPCRHHLQTGYTLPQGRVSLLSLPGSSPPSLGPGDPNPILFHQMVPLGDGGVGGPERTKR